MSTKEPFDDPNQLDNPKWEKQIGKAYLHVPMEDVGSVDWIVECRPKGEGVSISANFNGANVTAFMNAAGASELAQTILEAVDQIDEGV